MAPDMFSGWGMRTYARGQPGYNPIGYHTGTVWPHDVSLIAAGCKRYGFHDEANLLVGRIFQASQHFADFRLPELFCGFDRELDDGPGPVPGRLLAAGVGRGLRVPVRSRRCWACGRTRHRHELELQRPELPDWLTKVTVDGPAGRRRHDGPPVPSLARRHVGGGAAQDPGPRRHDPDVAGCPTPRPPSPSWSRAPRSA